MFRSQLHVWIMELMGLSINAESNKLTELNCSKDNIFQKINELEALEKDVKLISSKKGLIDKWQKQVEKLNYNIQDVERELEEIWKNKAELDREEVGIAFNKCRALVDSYLLQEEAHMVKSAGITLNSDLFAKGQSELQVLFENFSGELQLVRDDYAELLNESWAKRGKHDDFSEKAASLKQQIQGKKAELEELVKELKIEEVNGSVIDSLTSLTIEESSIFIKDFLLPKMSDAIIEREWRIAVNVFDEIGVG